MIEEGRGGKGRGGREEWEIRGLGAYLAACLLIVHYENIIHCTSAVVYIKHYMYTTNYPAVVYIHVFSNCKLLELSMLPC